ncbi:MAG: 6-phosphogluconolactonase [Aeromicrobium sp.]
MSVEISADAAALASSVAGKLVERIAAIQAQGTTPSVVLTGGTIANAIYAAINDERVRWEHVDFYWGDERFVPEGHADRNDQQARDAFLARLGVPESHIHAMPAHDCALSAAEAATAYSGEIPAAPFDLVLLGVGPDGHIASLFPGFAQLDEATRTVAEVFDSPKPPPVRITMTLPALNNAKSVWFLVSGAEKAESVARALGGADLHEIPATGVTGREETLWLLDEAGASKL